MEIPPMSREKALQVRNDAISLIISGFTINWKQLAVANIIIRATATEPKEKSNENL